MANQILLHIVIFLPLIASLLILVMRKDYVKSYAIFIAGIELLIILYLWFALENRTSFQFSSYLEIGYGLNYSVGVDSISLSLIMLSAILVLCSILYLDNKQNYLFIALLSLEGIVIGLFASTNALLFYMFWELSLIPTMCIIGNWGGERRFYASMKFVIYTVVMSLIMLFGILSLALSLIHI